jgi:uncharacterized damage-inducible protein DinB
MIDSERLVPGLFEGWKNYQDLLVAALKPLTAEQLALRPAGRLRAVGQAATHVVGARARWFNLLMGEGGEAFEKMGRWDRRGARPRTAAELVQGFEDTWDGMQAAIARWSPGDWQQTWPGEPPDEPETITRAWVIWHLIEHDLHHGGEISLTLGIHGLRAPSL